MKPVSKIAASVLLVLGAAALVFLLTHGNSALAFQEVADQLRNASTMTADMAVAAAGHTMTGKMMVKGQDHFRTELAASVSIVDSAAHRMLVLDTPHKLALVFKLEGDAPDGQDPADFVEKLRNISRDAGKPLGEATIDGVRAKQFNVTTEGQTFIIWADAKTGAPIRIDTSQDMGTMHTTMTLDHVKLDVPVDDSLFSVDPPQGYTVTQMPMSMSDPSEADVTELLKKFVDRSGGEFPPSLRDPKAMFQPIVGNKPPVNGAKPDPKMISLVVQSGRAMEFVNALPKSADWHYAGKDKRLGDASQPIFWYLPKDASQYRVIYGDLHASDVAAADVPQDAAAETQASNP